MAGWPVKKISEIDASELNNLAAGELVENISVRAQDFKTFWFETTMVSRTSTSDILVSLYVIDRIQTGYIMKAQRQAEQNVSFEVAQVVGRQVLTELAQLRAPRSASAELAMVILEELKRAGPENLAPFADRLKTLVQEGAA
jgi:hypothetical protein